MPITLRAFELIVPDDAATADLRGIVLGLFGPGAAERPMPAPLALPGPSSPGSAPPPVLRRAERRPIPPAKARSSRRRPKAAEYAPVDLSVPLTGPWVCACGRSDFKNRCGFLLHRNKCTGSPPKVTHRRGALVTCEKCGKQVSGGGIGSHRRHCRGVGAPSDAKVPRGVGAPSGAKAKAAKAIVGNRPMPTLGRPPSQRIPPVPTLPSAPLPSDPIPSRSPNPKYGATLHPRAYRYIVDLPDDPDDLTDKQDGPAADPFGFEDDAA